ncbi:MAG: hypothetical protein KBB54_03470 [Candidatus Pacebacteria bacterium]|nr:hypothetical protein [Candidatus Paceibacterota bacterium]
MSIIEKVKKLGLPLGQYVVISSGTLDALGIRPANDIDLTVLSELHEALRMSGEWKEENRYGKMFLIQEGIEINPDISWDAYPTSTEEVIRTALVIDGVPFMNLDELRKFKTALGREKDFADIVLMDMYLASNKSS